MKPELFTIKDTREYFRAGRVPASGKQLLIGCEGDRAVSLWFSADGVFLHIDERKLATPDDYNDVAQQIMDESGAVPSAVEVQRFTVPDRAIRIDRMPDYLEEFITSPDHFPNEKRGVMSEILSDWRESGNFVLVWNENYEMSRDGDVEST